ncbi:MAG: hypothetical protein SFU98_20190 [Leptospiraceae bacterium]|nr:hypothetical protein [Leptospiraceae bacterium]
MKLSYILFFLLNFSLFSKPNLIVEDQKRKPELILYGGMFVNADLMPIIVNGDISYRKSYIGVAAVNYPTKYKYKFVDFETEGQIAKHSGIMNHWEINGVIVGRVNNLFHTPISFGFGEGISFATQNPVLENQRKGFDRGAYNLEDIESRPLLNYLLIEFDYTLKRLDNEPKVFARIHHRSGIWGTFCPPNPPCGSNFLTYGVKIPF